MGYISFRLSSEKISKFVILLTSLIPVAQCVHSDTHEERCVYKEKLYSSLGIALHILCREKTMMSSCALGTVCVSVYSPSLTGHLY